MTNQQLERALKHWESWTPQERKERGPFGLIAVPLDSAELNTFQPYPQPTFQHEVIEVWRLSEWAALRTAELIHRLEEAEYKARRERYAAAQYRRKLYAMGVDTKELNEIAEGAR